MRRRVVPLLGLLLASLPHAIAADKPAPAALCKSPALAAGAPATVAGWAKGAQIFDGLGSFHRKATTASAEAQSYFDQGMRFLWAFNHDEATRSFARAAEIDPTCAACFWGVALTVGPNYNLPTAAAERAQVAWDALQAAKVQGQHASPVERALIDALAKRYPAPAPPADEEPTLAAYAEAMTAVAQHYPDDLDVQTLAAEAAMTVNAWKLWRLDGTPAPGTEAILTRLEAVLAKDPSHPGANHYYVHAVEASPHPERGVAAAERLRGMMPAAGHLEHMPAHIFQRVGRYAEAAEANRKGAAADLAYFAKTTPPDYYAMYTAHNYHFEAFSAAMEGRRGETIDSVRKLRGVAPDEMLAAMPGSDWTVASLYVSMVRFGLWDDILAEPEPGEGIPGMTAGYLAARIEALAAKGRIDETSAQLARLKTLAETTDPGRQAGFNSEKEIFGIALLKAQAAVARAQGRHDDAVRLLTEAVAREDRLAYDEPSDAFFPSRHLLGRALLESGRAAEAETAYREDLRRNPANGWALYGLAQALDAQGRKDDAAAVRSEFSVAWKNADVTLTASAF
ncbi:MAG TPA: tetratricopeptide repeat protein [Stellaceae bacterium]|nr:tetratricopeptide repeat protein [Stellaceae bacterium]